MGAFTVPTAFDKGPRVIKIVKLAPVLRSQENLIVDDWRQ